MKAGATAAALVALACTPSAADHVVLGDRNYVAGAYADALAEYQLGLRAGGAGADLHAKAGAAALHTEDYSFAAQEYRALAREDPSRADEAVDGLERAARGAVVANDRIAMAQALQGIREISPSRPLGPYPRMVALDAAAAGNTADALAYLPTAIATAPDARTADSLLYVLGEAAALAKDCVMAMAVFEGVLQRQRQPVVQDAAREGIARCALMRGQAQRGPAWPARLSSAWSPTGSTIQHAAVTRLSMPRCTRTSFTLASTISGRGSALTAA